MKKQVKMPDEFELIGRLAKLAGIGFHKILVKGIGDDCAVIRTKGKKYILVSTDTFNEEIHFKRKYSTFYEAGIKAATGGVSDIFAMGGSCDFLFISISIPENMNLKFVEDFYRGIKHVSDSCGAVIAGGDTTSSVRYFSTTITVMGNVLKQNLKLRSGAEIGDRVYVTGIPGYSLAGLTLLEKGICKGKGAIKEALNQHKSPMPYLNVQGIADKSSVTSMIDISDGLSSELNHIAKESNVRIRITLEELLTNPGLNELSSFLGIPVERLVLQSGEEYILLFTSKDSINRKGLIEIGRVEKGGAKVLIKHSGKWKTLSSTGYNHFIK